MITNEMFLITTGFTKRMRIQSRTCHLFLD